MGKTVEYIITVFIVENACGIEIFIRILKSIFNIFEM